MAWFDVVWRDVAWCVWRDVAWSDARAMAWRDSRVAWCSLIWCDFAF